MKHALVALALGAAALAGCAQPRESTPNAEGSLGVFRNAGEHGVTSREYRVDPPDEISIVAPNIKELDGQKQVVRPDGKISLDLVGEVFVAGLTPEEVSRKLEQLAERAYVKPEVRVQVVANSKFIYVFGFGTGKQGKLPYTGRVTVLNAVAEAGYSQDAWPEQVRISRPGRGGQPNATAVVNFKNIQSYGDLKQNYLLEEGDIIEIPFSPLSQLSFDLSRLLAPITGATSVVSAPFTAATTFQNFNNNGNRR